MCMQVAELPWSAYWLLLRGYYPGIHLSYVYLGNGKEKVIPKTSNGDVIADGYGISFFVDQSVLPKAMNSEV
ncbi:hypothetical protein N7471_005070 [Penicillium samsonianum]|uniref:uncharacterized protein n=1 Tax=Penicillium samsonianum TaxID=1882272 RepID=UPI002548511F|nr:uncharacterized protein N7471_005070 [Penicillium samsonianum]KAJ6138584.1 hypothetical protein N7471_005070 [Penicillium samsonianum]